jgi:L-arabinonolactonase
MSEIRCVASPRATVGEGPVWDDRRRLLWWVDIKSPRLFRFDPGTGENRAWPMPERIGCVALRENGGLIGAFVTGFKWIDPESGAVAPILDPEPDKPGNRFNDGKCDRRGRLFAGTMDNEEVACTGTLYRLDPDLSVHAVASDVHLSNGIGWSPDDRLMYHTDTLRHVIWVYDFDRETGEIDDRRAFAEVPEDTGSPDGLCVDAEGGVWSAHWGGWRLTRYRPRRADRAGDRDAGGADHLPGVRRPGTRRPLRQLGGDRHDRGGLRQGARRRRPVRARSRRARPRGPPVRRLSLDHRTTRAGAAR